MSDGLDLKQEAQALLDKAKTEVNVEARLSSLEALVDICVNKEPSLLGAFFPLLLTLQDSRSKRMELWYCAKLEELCQSHNECILLMRY